MSKRFQLLSLSLVLMAMIGLGAVSGRGVFAQDATPSAGSSSDSGTTTTDDSDNDSTPGKDGDFRGRGGHDGHGGPMMGGRGGWFGTGAIDKDALATFLGITSDELVTEIRAGSSLVQVAENHGKTRDELKAFLVEQFEAGLDDIIDATHDKATDDSTATPDAEATPAAATGLSA